MAMSFESPAQQWAATSGKWLSYRILQRALAKSWRECLQIRHARPLYHWLGRDAEE